MNSSYLLLSHLKIQNANALSSPFTIGFPAMTAWLGATHFLARRLIQQEKFKSLKITGVGVVSHDFHLQTHRGEKDFYSSIIGTGNPLDKDGKRSSFIEEARCHLDVSLVLEIEGASPSSEYETTLFNRLKTILSQMKFASGDLLSFGQLKRFSGEPDSQRKLIHRLMPGYGLIERRDLMIEAMKEKDALESLLDGLKVKYRSEKDKDRTVTWPGKRTYLGWIVPIATGFHGISNITEAGKTLNQRDPSIPHRFAESVVTLGEFVMTYRFKRIAELLWRYHYKPEQDLYVCEN